MDDWKARMAAITGSKRTPTPSTESVSPDDATVERLLDELDSPLRTNESNNRKTVKNSRTGAAGFYQVLPENIPKWTAKHLKRRMSEAEFLADEDAQRRVFRGEFGSYLREGLKRSKGDEETAIRRAGAAWYGGPGRMEAFNNSKRFRPNEPSYKEYGDKFVNLWRQSKTSESTAPSTIADLRSRMSKITGNTTDQPSIDVTDLRSRMSAITRNTAEQPQTPAPQIQGKMMNGVEVIDQPKDDPQTVAPVRPPPTSTFDQNAQLAAFEQYMRNPQNPPLTFEQFNARNATQQTPVVPQTPQTPVVQTPAVQTPQQTPATTPTDEMSPFAANSANLALAKMKLPKEMRIQFENEVRDGVRPNTAESFNEFVTLQNENAQKVAAELQPKQTRGRKPIAPTISTVAQPEKAQEEVSFRARPNDPIEWSVNYADKPEKMGLREWLDEQAVARMSGIVPGATEADIRQVLKQDTPWTDADGTPVPLAMTGKLSGAGRVTITAGLINLLDALVKRRTDKDSRKEQYLAQGLSDSEAELEAMLQSGTISPEQYNTTLYEAKLAEEKENEARAQFRNEFSLGFFQNLSPKEMREGNVSPDDMEAFRASEADKVIGEKVKQFGSMTEFMKQRARVQEEYKYRYMAAPSEFALNFIRQIANVPAQIGQAASILANEFNVGALGDFEGDASKSPFYQFWTGWEDRINSSKNTDIQSGVWSSGTEALLANEVADGLSQFATQAILFPVTGGASLALPLIQAGTAQYKEASKGGATRIERMLATTVGGLAAIPDALLQAKWLRPLMSGGTIAKFIDALSAKLFTNLSKQLPEAEARIATKNFVLAFISNTPVGFVSEYGQERLEDVTNKATAKLTYNPNITWEDVFIPNDAETRGYIAAGIAGAFGGNIELVVSKMSDADLLNADGVLGQAMKKGPLSAEDARLVAIAVQKEAENRKLEIKKRETIDGLLRQLNIGTQVTVEGRAGKVKSFDGNAVQVKFENGQARVFEPAKVVPSYEQKLATNEAVTVEGKPGTVVATFADGSVSVEFNDGTAGIVRGYQVEKATPQATERPDSDFGKQRDAIINEDGQIDLKTRENIAVPQPADDLDATLAEAEQFLASPVKLPKGGIPTELSRVRVSGLDAVPKEGAKTIAPKTDVSVQTETVRETPVSEKTQTEKEVGQKEPWEMTADEYIARRRDSRKAQAVELAQQIKDGNINTNDIGVYGLKKELTGTDAVKRAQAQLDALQGEQPDWLYVKEKHSEHWAAINRAIDEDSVIPAEVLADYPDLAEKYAQKPPVTEAEAASKEVKTPVVKGEDAVVGKGKDGKTKEDAQTIVDVGEKIGGARKDWRLTGLTADDLAGMSQGEESKYITKANIWKPDYAAITDANGAKVAAMIKVLWDGLAAKPRVDTQEQRHLYLDVMSRVRNVLQNTSSETDVKTALEQVQSQLSDPRHIFTLARNRTNPLRTQFGLSRKADKLVAQGFPSIEPWQRRFTVRKYNNEWVVVNRSSRVVERADTEADAIVKAQELYNTATAKDAVPKRPHLDRIERKGKDYRNGKNVTGDDFLTDFGFRGIEFGNWAASDERQRLVNYGYDALQDLANILGISPRALSLNGTLGLAFGARGGGSAAAHYEPAKLVINLTKINGAGALAHEWGHALDHYFGELNEARAYSGSPRSVSGWRDISQLQRRSLSNLRPEMQSAFRDVLSALFETERTKAEAVRDVELRLERLQAAIDRQQSESKILRERIGDAKPDQYQRKFLKESATWVSNAKIGLESTQRKLVALKGETAPQDGGYGKVESSYYKNAQQLSGKQGKRGYWARPTELFARAFESYVFDKIRQQGDDSNYLVQGVEGDRYASATYAGNPYPVGIERATLNAAFDKVFDTIEEETTDDGNVILKSVSSIEERDSPAYERELDSIKLTRDKDGKILAPNGKVSNIQNERLAKVIRSKAFLKWFGDWINDPKNASQAVDKNGEPLRVYHGTRGDFEIFSKEKLGVFTGAKSAEMGFFFSDDASIASSYPDGRLDTIQFESMPLVSGVDDAYNRLEVFNQMAEAYAEFDEEEGGYIGKIREYDDWGVEYTYDVDDQVYDTKYEAEDAADEQLEIERGKLELTLKKAEERFESRERDLMGQANVMPVFLNLRNPLIEDFYGNVYRDRTYADLLEDAVSEENDSAIFERTADGRGVHTVSDIFVAFSPNQIKSVFNRGSFSPEDNSILRKRRDAQSTNLLNSYLPYEERTYNVVENVESGFNANGELEVNEYGSEVIRRALAQINRNPDETEFNGLALSAGNLINIARKLKSALPGFERENYDTKPFTELIKNLEQLARSDFGIVYVYDDVLPHERVHIEDFRLGRTDARTALMASPVWAKSRKGKFQTDYGKKDKNGDPITSEADQISELAAILATGDGPKYGLTNEAENEAFLKEWARGVLNRHKAKIEEVGYEQFVRNFPTVGKYGKDTTDNSGRQEDTGVADNADERGAADGTPPIRQGQDQAQADNGVQAGSETEGRKDAKPESDRRLSAESERKIASFSRILGQDFEYDSQTNEATKVKADQLITAHGGNLRDAAMAALDNMRPSAEGMLVVYKYFGALNQQATEMRAEGLETEAEIVIAAIADLANRIVERQVATGQEVQIARLLEPLSPEVSLLTVIKMRKYNSWWRTEPKQKEEPLTPDQTKEILDLHAELDKAREAEAKSRQELAEAKRNERRYQSEKKGQRASRRAGKATQAQLLKEYKAKEAALLAKLQEHFPSAPQFAVLKMVAWHGSPHHFDKFSTEKIGTGEGAQAYGYGLYFASSEDVADFYRKQLEDQSVENWAIGSTRLVRDGEYMDYSPRNRSMEEQAKSRLVEAFFINEAEIRENIRLNNALPHIAASAVMERVAEEEIASAKDDYPELVPYLEEWLKDVQTKAITFDVKRSGAKYKVDLKPSEDEYLLWDKPLSEQSEKVKKELQTLEPTVFSDQGLMEAFLGSDYAKAFPDVSDVRIAKRIYNEGEYEELEGWAKKQRASGVKSSVFNLFLGSNGSHLYSALTNEFKTQKAASDYLLSLGVRGIKYLDGSSRNKGEGDYNYVLFDSSDIQILELNATPITLLEDDTANAERLIDTLRPDIENFRDRGDTKIIREKGFRSLNIPTQNLSLARVFRLAQNLKIRDAIIKAIPVDVVNLLKSVEITPQMLLHNPTVFGNLLSLDRDNPITGLVDTSSATASDITGLRTKSGVPSTTPELNVADRANTDRASNRSQSAIVATEFRLSDTARMKVRDGLATATASVLAHTDIVPQSFDDADVEITEVLKSVSSAPLTDEEMELLSEYAAGQILQNLPYKDLIDTLSEMTGADIEQIKDVHAMAVETIRNSRPASTDAQKEALKTRMKHYREAKKFRKGDAQGRTVVAQEVAEKFPDDEQLIYAAQVLTDTKQIRSINNVINDIKTKFNLNESQAETLAKRAQKEVIAARADIRQKRDDARSITAEARKQLDADRNAKLKAINKLNRLLNETVADPNAMKRFNNITRGAVVNNWATQAFNATQTIVVTTPYEAILDILDAGVMQSLGINIGENNADIRLRDAWKPLAYNWWFGKNLTNTAERALAHYPEQWLEMHKGLMGGDIDIKPHQYGKTKKHWPVKAVHYALDAGDWVNSKTSKYSGAVMQEAHYRNAVAMGYLDMAIRKKTQGAKGLTKALDDGTFDKLITEADVKIAVERAMKATMAESVSDPAGRFLMNMSRTLDNFLPLVLNPVMFARFTYTVSRNFVINPLLFSALDSKRATEIPLVNLFASGQGYNNRSLAKGILAYSSIGIAYLLKGMFDNDDDKWYTLNINGEVIDIRRWFPIAPAFFAAYILRRIIEGKPLTNSKTWWGSVEEVIGGLFSLEFDYFQYGAGINALYTAADVLTNGESLTEDLPKIEAAAGRVAGAQITMLLRFLKPAKDIAASLTQSESALREYDRDNNSMDAFMEEMAKTLPIAGLYGAPEQVDPVTGLVKTTKRPMARWVGGVFVNDDNIPKAQSAATMWAERYFGGKGSGGRMTIEQLRAYRVRQRIINAMRKKEINAADAERILGEQVKKGAISTEQAKAIGKVLVTPEIITALTGFGAEGFNLYDKNDVKNIRIVINKANETETRNIAIFLNERVKSMKDKGGNWKPAKSQREADTLKHYQILDVFIQDRLKQLRKK